MPAKDIYHDAVKAALIADGWTITNENDVLRIGTQRVFIDLEAERTVITAEHGDTKIAVAVTSVVGASAVVDLRDAVGQYVMERSVLRRLAPERVPWLAVDVTTANAVFTEPLAHYLLADAQVHLLVVDSTTKRSVAWRS